MQTELFEEQLKEGFSETNKDLLKALIQTGCNPKIVHGFLEVFCQEMPVNLRRYFGSPIVGNKSAWTASNPEWLVPGIYEARLDRIYEELQEKPKLELATYPELVYVMMPTSMDGPMHSEYVDIYLYACREAAPYSHGFVNMNGFDKLEIRELDEYKTMLMNNILTDIRKKVVQQHWRQK